MNPTSQHQFGLSGAVTEPQPAPAVSPSPSASLALQRQQQQNLQQLQWLPHPGVSCGSISSEHIRWVTSLRLRKGRWLSEMQQARWTQTENDYYEFTFELFQSGFLEGVEIGLPIRYFMSELLGCSVQRIDQKLVEDKRIPNLRCPRLPQRELVECERQGLIKKLRRLERAFLVREKGPLLDRVRYNSPEDASRFLHLFYGTSHEVDQDRFSVATSTTSAARPSSEKTIATIMLPTLSSLAAAGTSRSTVDMAPGTVYTSHMMPASTSQVVSTPDVSPALTAPSTQAAQRQGTSDQQQLDANFGYSSGYSSSATGVISTNVSSIMTMTETVASLNSAKGAHPESSESRPTSPAGSITTAADISSSQTEVVAGTRGAYSGIDAEGSGLRQTSSPAGSMTTAASTSSHQTGVSTVFGVLSTTGARSNEMRHTSSLGSMVTSAPKPSYETGVDAILGGYNGLPRTSSPAGSLTTAVDMYSYKPGMTAVVDTHSAIEAGEDGLRKTSPVELITSAVEISSHTTGAAAVRSGAYSATGAEDNGMQQKISSTQTPTTMPKPFSINTFEVSNRRPRISTPEALPQKDKEKDVVMLPGQQAEVLQQSQGQQISVFQKEQGQQEAAYVDPPFPPVHGLLGEALGLNLLGVRRKESPGEGPPPAKRRGSTGGVRQDGRGSGSGTGNANGGDLLPECLPDSVEDEAAMEYLKWELHGKFMAFPGEHYHNLLSCLVSEIYHNRYPVEYGVDILHAVMREAGPGAAKKCANTLKKMNLTTKGT